MRNIQLPGLNGAQVFQQMQSPGVTMTGTAPDQFISSLAATRPELSVEDAVTWALEIVVETHMAIVTNRLKAMVEMRVAAFNGQQKAE